jgi:hypothetical protein
VFRRIQVSAIKKFQKTNLKYQMVRQAVRQAHGPEQSRRTHHLTTLSQVEGQIAMTEIQNSTRLSSSQAKQLVFDLI